jgi:hypothetical protein
MLVAVGAREHQGQPAGAPTPLTKPPFGVVQASTKKQPMRGGRTLDS